MTLVVADTGPIRYLVIIEAIGILPKLFDRVVLPRSVMAELSHPRAPSKSRDWASNLPAWAEVRSAHHIDLEKILDPGEAEAIALALELKASALLLDEAEGRKHAISRGLPVAGTVGLLEKAASHNLLNLREALNRLRKTNFRIDPRILREALERAGEK